MGTTLYLYSWAKLINFYGISVKQILCSLLQKYIFCETGKIRVDGHQLYGVKDTKSLIVIIEYLLIIISALLGAFYHSIVAEVDDIAWS